MKVPSTLTTVTKFSKFLALVMFILLPFIGFFFGMAYQQNITGVGDVTNPAQYSNPSPTPTPTLTTTLAPTLSETTANLVWEVPSGTIARADETSLKNEIVRLSPTISGQLLSSYLAVTNVKIQGGWAVLTVVVKDRTTKEILPTDIIQYFAHKGEISWTVTTDASKNLCGFLKQFPDPIPASLVDSTLLSRYGCR